MAAYKSEVIRGRVYTITGHPVHTLSGKPYVEYRLEERRGDGSFVGWHAFGDLPFVERAFNAIPREDRRCFCPGDCNCHYPWRVNYCGCRQHDPEETA